MIDVSVMTPSHKNCSGAGFCHGVCDRDGSPLRLGAGRGDSAIGKPKEFDLRCGDAERGGGGPRLFLAQRAKARRVIAARVRMRPRPVADEDDAHRPARVDCFEDQRAAAEALVIGVGRDNNSAAFAKKVGQSRGGQSVGCGEKRVPLHARSANPPPISDRIHSAPLPSARSSPGWRR